MEKELEKAAGEKSTTPESVKIGDSVLYQIVGDEILILNMDNQQYFGLDSVAADIWKMLMEHRDISDVCRRLTSMYSVDETTARTDVQNLVSELLAADLVRIDTSSGSLSTEAL
jgi:hypothetical protein